MKNKECRKFIFRTLGEAFQKDAEISLIPLCFDYFCWGLHQQDSYVNMIQKDKCIKMDQ